MQIWINGKPEDAGGIATIKELVRMKSLPEKQIVIELNGGIVKREQWEDTLLQAEDRIEILRFVGGG
jgi:thiamine biosynthesis protein ThiS